MALRISLKWLQDYVDTPLSPEALAERFTVAGLEVESVTEIGRDWSESHLVVGEIQAVHPHENAEKLCVVTVNYGAASPLVLVTGAPNIKAFLGQPNFQPLKVPIALVGATVLDAEGKSFQIKPAKIRGIESHGMLCSQEELGLGEAHDGVWILPADAPAGTSLKQYLGDTIYEFGIKGGFSYLLSVFGIARETVALTGSPLKFSPMDSFLANPPQTSKIPPFAKLHIDDSSVCPRYIAALVRNIKIAPSPFWLQQRLSSLGMRPINNVVDVTNYVMLEMGQPLHAFDYQVLQQRSSSGIPAITVRFAQSGEPFQTLDGVERVLDDKMLVIADEQGPLALAGIMGGQNSAVSTETTTILLEAANFNFLNNRRTCQLLKLQTESSERFGKQLDPDLPLAAIHRAAEWMVALAEGTIDPIYGDLYLAPPPSKIIAFDPKRISRLLGISITEPEIQRILESLEFKVDASSPLWNITVPSYRLDIQGPPDLIEEISRVYGYDRMPPTLLEEPLPPQKRNHRLETVERIRDVLVGTGLSEIITYSIIDPEKAQLVFPHATDDEKNYLSLINPLVQERSHLRRSLLPGGLQIAQQNLQQQNRVCLFEVGAVFHPDSSQVLPQEPYQLSVILSGRRISSAWNVDMSKDPKNGMDFYDIKGILGTLFADLHLPIVRFVSGSAEPFHPGRCAEIFIGNESLGFFGELHPQIQKQLGFSQLPVLAAELKIDPLVKNLAESYPMASISTYAPVYEDLAFVVDESCAAEDLRLAILKTGKPYLQQVEIFDVYRGERLGAGKKV